MQACGSALLPPGLPCMLSLHGLGDGDVGRCRGKDCSEARGRPGQGQRKRFFGIEATESYRRRAGSPKQRRGPNFPFLAALRASGSSRQGSFPQCEAHTLRPACCRPGPWEQQSGGCEEPPPVRKHAARGLTSTGALRTQGRQPDPDSRLGMAGPLTPSPSQASLSPATPTASLRLGCCALKAEYRK